MDNVEMGELGSFLPPYFAARVNGRPLTVEILRCIWCKVLPAKAVRKAKILL